MQLEHIAIDMEVNGQQYRHTITFAEGMTLEEKIAKVQLATDCVRNTIIVAKDLYEVS